MAAGLVLLAAAGSNPVAAQIAPTSPAMATVTVPPASAEPPPPPPLDSADMEVEEEEPGEAESLAEPEPAQEPAPQPAPPADYRADLFGEAHPETGADLPAAPLPPARADEPAPPAPMPAQAVTLPSASGLLDSASVQRAIDRLVALHFLASPADGQNPDTLVQAIKDFQTSIGISPTGTMDRDTVGRLTLP